MGDINFMAADWKIVKQEPDEPILQMTHSAIMIKGKTITDDLDNISKIQARVIHDALMEWTRSVVWSDRNVFDYKVVEAATPLLSTIADSAVDTGYSHTVPSVLIADLKKLIGLLSPPVNKG